MWPESTIQEALFTWAPKFLSSKPRRGMREVFPVYDAARRARAGGRRDTAAEDRLAALMHLDGTNWGGRRAEIDEHTFNILELRDVAPRWQIMRDGEFYASLCQFWDGRSWRFHVTGGIGAGDALADAELVMRVFRDARAV